MIECPKFGGSRFAPACITQDRYKSCRRRCQALGKLLEENPTLPEQALKLYRDRAAKKKQGDGQIQLFAPCKLAGKFLPNLKVTCPWCGFKGKSSRGLLVHVRRTHGKRTLLQR